MKEERYNMGDLIFFLLGESMCCYQTVEQVLDVVEDKSIPFETKNEMIKALLRKAGLDEVGYLDESAPPKQKQVACWEQGELNGLRIPVKEYLMRYEDSLELINIFLN